MLVDALKFDAKHFKNSNLILKNGRALKAIYMVKELEHDLLEFAKNPETSAADLPAPPKTPKLENLTAEEQEQAKAEYQQLLDAYEAERVAITMQVPLIDKLLIDKYLEKFDDTIQTVPAVKGKRFFALTKNLQEEQGGFLGFLHKGNQQQ